MIKFGEFIRKGCLEKFYYCDKSGKIDEFMEALDCWEQILMYALMDYHVDGKKNFCDDVTPFLAIDNSSWELRKNIYANYSHFFDIIDIEVQSNPIEKNETLLKKNKVLAVSTMFDLIPNYVWYDPNSKGEHHNHFCMFVGYNDEEFYIVDSISVFEPLRDSTHLQNPTIHIVQKKDLIYPFKLYCEISEISINSTREVLLEYNPYKQVIIQIVNSFYCTSITQEEGKKVYKGKLALMVFKKLVMENFDHVLLQEYFMSHFDVHLIISRHNLLKWNLLLNEYSYKKNYFYLKN